MPWRFSEANFNRFTLAIEDMLANWPKPVEMRALRGLTLQNTSIQLRCAIQGACKYGWKTPKIDLEFLRASEIDIVVRLREDSIVFGHRETTNPLFEKVPVRLAVEPDNYRGYDMSRLCGQIKPPFVHDKDIVQACARLLHYKLMMPIEFVEGDHAEMTMWCAGYNIALLQQPGTIVMI